MTIDDARVSNRTRYHAMANAVTYALGQLARSQ